MMHCHIVFASRPYSAGLLLKISQMLLILNLGKKSEAGCPVTVSKIASDASQHVAKVSLSFGSLWERPSPSPTRDASSYTVNWSPEPRIF